MAEPSLSETLSALPMPMVAIDQTERIIAANQRGIGLLGQGALGRHFITALRQPALVEAVGDCLKDNTARVASYLAGDAVREISYDVHLQRMGAAGIVILSFQDMTQLTQAGQMRRDFVANVSHELRTPLTSLMGFIDTLRGPARDDSEARARFLDIMAGEAERMNRLVGDLLSLSRVESEERVRPTAQIDLAAVLGTAVKTLSPLAAASNVVLTPDYGERPIHVLGDSDQLLQVFTNLIENAIKYGGAGNTVTIAAETVERDPSLRGSAVRISVMDQGPGIDPHHLPRLTERFYRADSHRSRSLGGTGLGLAIVKHILNRHRGRLKITSEQGQGAQFTAALPLDAEGDATSSV